MIRSTTAKAAALLSGAALVLAACGGVNDEQDDTAAAGSESAACQSTAGISDTEIKVGGLTDLSGPVAAGGVPYSQGVQAYFNMVNQDTAPLGGRKITLDTKDTQYDPQKAIAAYREISNDVVGLPLSFTGLLTGAISTQAQSECVPVVANPGSKHEARDGIYYTGSTYDVSVINLMDYYVNELGKKDAKVGIIYQVGGFGEGAVKALEWAAPKLGYEVVGKQSFAPTDKAFNGQLSALQKTKPDVLVMASSGAATFGIFGAAEAAGADWEWLGLQPTFIPAVFGLPISEPFQEKVTMVYGGPVLEQGGENIDAAIAQLKKDYPDQVENPPALLGWQAAHVFYTALVEAYENDNLTRGGIRSALSTLQGPTGGLGDAEFNFDPEGTTPTEPWQSNLIVKADQKVTGGLTILQDWTESPLVAEYNDSL